MSANAVRLTRGQRRLIRTRCRDLVRFRSEILYAQLLNLLTLDAEAGRVNVTVEGVCRWRAPGRLSRRKSNASG